MAAAEEELNFSKVRNVRNIFTPVHAGLGRARCSHITPGHSVPDLLLSFVS